MEQDIEILKRIVNYRKFDGIYSTNEVIFKAIEHLIKAYKELEEKNKKKSIEIICYQEELENSIPVSLVEEKIEKLNKKLNNGGKKYGGCVINPENIMKLESQIDVLQELLEKRK